jgi:hypothetical protein
MVHRAFRIGAAGLVLMVCAVASNAQSSGVTATIAAGPNRVAPGDLLNVTLTITNRGPATGTLYVGIIDVPAATIVRMSVPAGVKVEYFPSCAFGDCSPPFTGFGMANLAMGSSVAISASLRIDGTPGETFTVSGIAFGPSTTGARATSPLVTTAGSGVPPPTPVALTDQGIRWTDVTIRPSDAVFDPVDRVYVVEGEDGTFANIIKLDLDGATSGGPVNVSAIAARGFPWPAAAYSADLGGAMLVSNDGSRVYVGAVPFSGAVAGRVLIGTGVQAIDTNEIAYSSTSRRFLAAWQSVFEGLQIRLVGLDARPIGPAVLLEDFPFETSSTPLAWNPVSNEFGLAYFRTAPRSERQAASGYPGTLELVRISVDGMVLTRTRLATVDAPVRPKLAVNPYSGDYVVVWQSPAVFGVFGAEVRADGRVVSRGLVAKNFSPASLTFNSVSKTFLLVGNDASSFKFGVVELNQYGAPLGSAIPTEFGIPEPVVMSRPDTAQWRIFGLVSPGFNLPSLLASEGIQSFSIGGGSETRLGGCVTPDPFVIFGGGVCFDGGWLPPGAIARGTSITYGAGRCSTPDPFVVLGGGTCANGGWYPPGMGSPAPAPPPIPGGCLTPDPFVALGGGTCANGGWYPPGMGSSKATQHLLHP